MKVTVKFIVFCSICTLCFVSFGHLGEASSPPTGKVVIAQGGEIDTLDAHLLMQIVGNPIIACIFDYPVHRLWLDDQMQYLPMLATSWETPNKTTWIFHLRKGVKFHNGEDFNAEAFKYSIERVLDPKTKARRRHLFTKIDRVEILDAYTVRVTTKVPDPTLLLSLAHGMPIVPPKYYSEKPGDYLATHPVGSGPFKFVRWTRDEELVLEANRNYWGGPPKIETVVFKPIPEDSTRVAALVGGDVDIIRDVPIHLVEMVNKSGRAKVMMASSAMGTSIFLDTVSEGPLQDKRVRQAINYAVDKETIIATILGGHASPLGQIITPIHFGYDPSVKPYPYDPEKARALLKEAGYGDGFTITLNSSQGRYPKDKEVVEAIAGQLSKVGITVKIQFHEWGEYIKKMFGPQKLGPMFLVGWASIFDADGVMHPLLYTGGRVSIYSNKELDNLLDEARATVDQEERKGLYSKAVRLCHEEAPALFLYYGRDTYGVSNRVQNWFPTPDIHRAFYMHKRGDSFPSIK